MKNIVCCFPIEIKVRALDARLYLVMKCLSKGYTCLLGSKQGVHEAMFKLKTPFIYFTKGIGPTSVVFLDKIKSQGNRIIYLDEEGGPSRIDEDVLLQRYVEKPLAYIDLICAWGETQKKVILKRKNIKEEQIIITGHPRFDMRKSHFTPYYKKIRPKRNIWKQKYIQFNMNFGMANNHWGFEELLQNYKREYLTRTGVFDKKEFEDTYKNEVETFNSFTQTICNIVIKYPTLTVVVRPHPSEKPSTYHKLFDKYDNILVSNEGSVQEWIVDALAIIHRDCTTAIETFFMRKPVFSYQPIEIPEHLFNSAINQMPVEVSEVVKSEAVLLERVGQLLENTYPKIDVKTRQEQEEKVKTIFANIDFDSADKIVEVIENFVVEKSFTFEGTGNVLNELSPNKIKIQYQKTKTKIWQTLNAHKTDVQREKAKFSGLDKEEIVTRIEALKTVMPIPSYQVKEVGQNCFLLSQ